MRGERVSVGLRAALRIFTATLFVTSTWAAGQETVLHNFDNNGTDGAYPSANLVFDAVGNLYGTTEHGGAYNAGTVFELTPAVGGGWTETVLHSFGNGTDGAAPYADVILNAGNLYGTTTAGGTYGDGTVFELTPSPGGGWTEQVLYSFEGGTNDGRAPYADLIFDAAGNLYGTTEHGGIGDIGTVFELTPSPGGGWTEQVVYRFENDPDGALPLAGLIFDPAGNLYGTTYNGGRREGTVFQLMPVAGGGWTEGVLYTFTGGNDGGGPEAGLIVDAADDLYGTTVNGGTYGYGTVFELTPTPFGGWTEKVLHNFNNNGTDGAYPYAGLVFDAAGNLYGTTYAGGSYGVGMVFELTPEAGGGWMESVLHSFIFNGTDGAYPYAGLISDAAGNLYGTTYYGGTYGSGTVFEVTPRAALQLVTAPPCRVVDTRNPNGPFGGPPIQGGTFRSFPLPQNQTCNIPTSVVAYSLNVTVVPQGPLGYLTIWPTGQNQPLVSTLNSTDGRVKANAAIVLAGTSGAVSVYVTNTANVILDIDGYFEAPGSGTLQFYPLTPCRLVDTRGANGPLGGPHLPAQQERDFPLLTSSCIPSGLNIEAYSLNFTVVPNPSGQQLGYLTVWPTGEPQPTVSTLNNPTATVAANAAIVPAGTDGDVAVYAYNTTDLLIDINGYFAAPGTGGLSMYSQAPCRVLDTRQNNGQPFMGQKVVNVVGSPCAPSSSAQAYVFNSTVVPPGPMPYLTLWPNGEQQPAVSTLNAYDGFITSNMAIVPTNNGSIDAYADGLTQLILDISGYFAP